MNWGITMNDTFEELLRLVQQAAEARDYADESPQNLANMSQMSLEQALDELFDFYWRDCYPG